jgi:hypothetical protein
VSDDHQMTLEEVLQTVTDAQPEWAQLALNGIRHLAQSGQRFQAYDVALLGVPEPTTSAQWGAVFHRAKALGLIRRCGYAPSRRPTVAGSACAEWVGSSWAA